jgi:hypothetical protein
MNCSRSSRNGNLFRPALRITQLTWRILWTRLLTGRSVPHQGQKIWHGVTDRLYPRSRECAMEWVSRFSWRDMKDEWSRKERKMMSIYGIIRNTNWDRPVTQLASYYVALKPRPLLKMSLGRIHSIAGTTRTSRHAFSSC